MTLSRDLVSLAIDRAQAGNRGYSDYVSELTKEVQKKVGGEHAVRLEKLPRYVKDRGYYYYKLSIKMIKW